MAEASVQLLRMETPVADVVRTNPRVTRVMVHNPPRENPFPGKDVVARWVDDAFDGQCLSYGATGAGLDGEWTFANDDAGAVVLRRVEKEAEPEPEPEQGVA